MYILSQVFGLAILVPLVVVNPPSATTPLPAVTVCSALAHAEEYNGKMVRITAKVVGTDEGTWLSDHRCDGAITVNGHALPALIWLQMPDQRYTLHPVSFSFDFKSQSKTSAKYDKFGKHWVKDCVEWTYTGMFETRSDWKREVAPNGRFNGFGHLNGAPAQIVIKSLDDVGQSTPCPVESHRK